MAESIYINGVFVKTGKFGLRVSINVHTFIEELKKHNNAKGYVNVDINPRKEADKNGNTHFVKLDTWQPTQQSAPSNQNTFLQQPNGVEPIDDLPF